MNKSLEKMISKVAKPAAKVLLPLALTFGAYQGANAQINPPPVNIYEVNVVVESEQSKTIDVNEEVTYDPIPMWKSSTRHLDMLKVYQPSTGDHYSLLYMGDLSWNKDDTLKLNVAVHKDKSKSWTDDELSEYYLNETIVNASTPSRKQYCDGVITEVVGVKSGKK